MKKIENKSNTMRHLEQIYGLEIEELLKKMYVDKGLTINQIAEELIVSHKTIWKWMQLAGISARKMKWE